MGDTKNTNKKLLIAIFTAPFLIGFIYSVYPQATSAQNNAVSSLESNSIIQEIISSSANAYSSAGQYFVNFLSIKGIPTYIWTIIIFLITTLFFIGIYTFLFEIFVKRIGIEETETMKKAKILFIFVLSVFSAIAIGYAIPFLINLYGLILLILVIIALFFFGRAMISYGRSFHYATKSFEVNTRKDLLELERELKKKKGTISQEYSKYLEEGIKESINDLGNINAKLKEVDNKYDNILSTIIKERDEFINHLIDRYNKFYNDNKDKLIDSQKEELGNLIDQLHKIKKDTQQVLSIRQLYEYILKKIQELRLFVYEDKQKLQNLLKEAYDNTNKQDHNQILKEIGEALKEYNNTKSSLMELYYKYENTIKKNIGSKFKELLGASNKLEKDIKETEKSINKKIDFLENLKSHLY